MTQDTIRNLHDKMDDQFSRNRMDYQLGRVEELTSAFHLIMQALPSPNSRPVTLGEISALFAICNGLEDVLAKGQ